MTSMTGYAYTEKTTEKAQISVEIKSVNSRFLDLTINLPPFLNPIESYFRELISEKVVRGKVDVYIKVKELQSSQVVTADVEAAKSYLDAVKQVAGVCGYGDGTRPSLKLQPQEVSTSEDCNSIRASGHSNKSVSQETEVKISGDISDADFKPPLDFILSQPGVLNITSSYDVELYKSLIEPVFKESLEKFTEDTEREGKNLFDDLIEKLNRLDECAEVFAKWQPEMENHFKELITQKFNEIVGEAVEENRIMTEVAAMVVKYTINEEIVRLKSHLKAMREEMQTNPNPGKKLDFICQEINREINTIGSKNQSAEVGAVVITAKDAIENIREQAKNVC